MTHHSEPAREAVASEQTDRYHKRPFTGFAPRDEKRRKQTVTLPMDVLLAIVRERLEYLKHGSDLDAVAQNAACEIERAMGVFPNLEGTLSASPAPASGLEAVRVPTDAEIDELFGKVYAHCVIKYDPEAGKRVIRAALASPAATSAETVDVQATIAKLAAELGCEAAPATVFREALKIARDAAPSETAMSAETQGGDGGREAWRDVLAERRRQVEAEGWSSKHDDEHRHGEMAAAAGCYALAATVNRTLPVLPPKHWWPWSGKWWKPAAPRRMLVKAAALILAEIERLDRQEAALDDRGCGCRTRCSGGCDNPDPELEPALAPSTSAATRGVRCAYCGDTGTITDRVDGEITCPECGYPPAPAVESAQVKDARRIADILTERANDPTWDARADVPKATLLRAAALLVGGQ